MLFAYSDATIKDHTAVATTLLLTEGTFVNCFSKRYEDVESSVEAELLGVVQTMEYLAENCNDESKIVLLIDNRSIVMKYIKILNTWEVPKDYDFRSLYQRLLAVSKGFNVNVQHIRGHQHTHNPNKVCDILSTVYLKLGGE